jgi:hypothetical protein
VVFQMFEHVLTNYVFEYLTLQNTQVKDIGL